ncbi:MAG: hypothetical protein ACFBZ8_02195 [Opitutales bacterium]
MKLKISLTLAAASLAIGGVANAATFTATSDTFGYQTYDLVQGFNAFHAPLLGDMLASGQFESAAGAVLTDDEATWNTNDFVGTDSSGRQTFFVLLTSGANDGAILPITATDGTANTVTVTTAGVAAGTETYQIFAASSFDDLFGANDLGLAPGTAFDQSTADFIFVATSTGVFTSFYFQSDFTFGSGFRQAPNFADDVGDTVVYPDEVLLIQDTSGTTNDLIISGMVNPADFSIDLPSGFSFINRPFPVGSTLDSLGLFTDGVQGVDATGTAFDQAGVDLVFIAQPGGTFISFYFQDDGVFGTGWRQAPNFSDDEGGTVIPIGSGILFFNSGAANIYEGPTPVVP